ncbi:MULTISPECIES: hypothetical protein [Inquilinus]|jgi:hypothetical protein|uniref:Hemolysin n=1 Tax=Inquilinus ginsengisoli TaxID=363840 RepID=A0ABU1JZX7_9PROT|nr:hypothetical protein [Inquilinus ginsengisoli]MDR6293579.1 putative hemolysin [Inquilinus ginsengisoli]
MRSICLAFAALLAGACVPQPVPKNFVVVSTVNERDALGAQATADFYCGKTGRVALATDRQWNYIGFQCIVPASTVVAQTPIPARSEPSSD